MQEFVPQLRPEKDIAKVATSPQGISNTEVVSFDNNTMIDEIFNEERQTFSNLFKGYFTFLCILFS